MEGRKELVVACGNNMSAGIRIWDPITGDELLRLPTCASPLHGLLFSPGRFLAASQLQNHRPYGGGAVFVWPLHKPQAPCRSYPMEEIGPIACSIDGVYLVGGAPSGNIHIWEVTSGRLLKYWHAHESSLICFAFTADDSLLISGSSDGVICIWSMISLLDIADSACTTLPALCTWSEHQSSVTSLLPLSGHSNPVLISSSLDGMCKVWNLVSGKAVQTYICPAAVTAIAVDPGEQMLFAGCEDGKIHIAALNVGFEEDPIVILGWETGESITVLKFSLEGSWLISASKDCAVCIWDALSWQIIRRFNYGKGHITNLLVIPKSSLAMFENQRNSTKPRVSILEKSPQHNNASEGTPVHLLSCSSQEDHLFANGYRSLHLFSKQLCDLEKERTAKSIELKVEVAIENRVWILAMTKHVTSINKELQATLLGMIQQRLSQDSQKKVRQEGRKKAKKSPPNVQQQGPT